MKRLAVLLMLLVMSCQAGCAKHITRTPPQYPYYRQLPVTNPFKPRYKICFVGDSVVYWSDKGYGWMDILNQMNTSYHGEYEFQLINAGYANLSSTVLGYSDQWQQRVVNTQPNVVVIWIGIDNILVNHGIESAGSFDMAAYGQDLQAIIDAARQIPSVEQIVLVTPMAAGERYYGQNPQDSQLDNLIKVVVQTSVNNKVPVINMNGMIRSAEYMFNRGDYPSGVLLGDGIHPYTPNWPPRPGFNNQATNQMIAATFFQAFGE